MEVTKTIEQPLLARKRVTVIFEKKGPTPSNKEIKTSLSKQLAVKEEVIEIRHIYNKFGDTTSKAIAHIYDSKENKNRFEVKSKKQREKEAKASEKKEAPKEEAETKEEPKAKGEQ
ncbi:hypothetical protein KY330_01375 [Candidatus Woesearchaeota archaeon]|nr:hypothetical protein [Candidatus Woesearchaeota archaeon]